MMNDQTDARRHDYPAGRPGRRRAKAARYAPAALLAGFWTACILVQFLAGGSFFGPSDYSSYTLQAMAWRRGQTALSVDYEWLELAVYNGKWYVSFPPVPSVPMYFLTFLFGYQTPDSLMVKLYAMAAALAIYSMLVRCHWNRWHASGMALLMTLGGSMLPLVSNGAVWYQAQVMAFMLTTASIALMTGGRMTGSLLLYALAVGCRPFNVCYGPLLMILWYLRRPAQTVNEIGRGLGPGVVLGLLVAAAYAAYNYVRFGDIFEFGHNYLPEFVRSANGQFSLKHLAENARQFLLGLPLYRTAKGWEFEQFGCSVFLGNPMLLLMIVWFVVDLIRGRMNLSKGLTVGFFAVHLFLLLLHRTGGGFQLGARYAVDLVPYSLIYLGLRREKHCMAVWETVILCAGFAVMLIGTYYVHL